MQRTSKDILMLIFAAILHTPISAQSDPVVRVVYFHSPTCHYCEQVMNETLPDLISTYNKRIEWFYVPNAAGSTTVGLPGIVELRGDTLQLLYVRSDTDYSMPLLYEMVTRLNIPADRLRYPAVLVGDQHLVGFDEIPNLLPGIIDNALEKEGTEWPELAFLELIFDELIPVPASGSEDAAALRLPPTTGAKSDRTSASILEKIKRDPLGNTLSIILLSIMVLSVPAIVFYARTKPSWKENQWVSIAIPILAVLGAVVGAYLAVGEATGGELSCGPVGDCNAVQNSQYAMLFGFLPVALLGLIAYVAIIIIWFLKQLTGERVSGIAAMGLFAIAGLGMLFSIYLTILEPFVIGATCLWCLSSAVIITLLTWLTSRPAVNALRALRGGEKL